MTPGSFQQSDWVYMMGGGARLPLITLGITGALWGSLSVPVVELKEETFKKFSRIIILLVVIRARQVIMELWRGRRECRRSGEKRTVFFLHSRWITFEVASVLRPCSWLLHCCTQSQCSVIRRVLSAPFNLKSSKIVQEHYTLKER